MKVLIVLYGDDYVGGTSRSTFTIAAGLARRGHDVHAFAHVTPAGLLVRDLKAAGVTVHDGVAPVVTRPQHERRPIHRAGQFAIGQYLRLVACPKAERQIAQIIDEQGIELVAISGGASISGQRAAQQAGLPYVWHIREFMQEDHGHDYFDWTHAYERMRGAACLVCVSQAVERKMAGICPDTPLRVVYNGLDTSVFNAEGRVPAGAGEPLRIMTSGGIRHSKGTFLVVEALSKLSEQHGELDWRLDIYGGEGGRVGETAEALREMCERLGVAQRVRYLGQTDAIADAYRAHDVLVMASRAEAFGRVTAEAMLCGCAVVGSDSGGTPELIADGRGYLYAPQDADSLAQALVQAAGDPQERQRRVMVAQTYAQEHFGAATYVDAIEGIYHDAIAAARLH